MKQTGPFLLAVLAAVTPLGVTSCGHKKTDGPEHSKGHAPEAEAVAGISFKAKHGLLVPPSTAKFIGLEVADVQERTVASTLQFSAQVYRAANEPQAASTQSSAALASGTVSARQAAFLREGQPVSVAGVGMDALAGRVAGLNRDLEKATGQVEVLLVIDDVGAQLTRPGFVSVEVTLGGDKPVVSVPRSALLSTTEGDFVYTVSGDHFVRAAVTLGMVNQRFAEVVDGLLDGDIIVVEPVRALWLAELQSIRSGKACADGH
jgi:hypothetical protein